MKTAAQKMVVDAEELAQVIYSDPWWFVSKWFGDEPAIPKQRELLEALRDHDQVFCRACYDSTKALALDTMLPTPTGWTTMGDIAVGDILYDERGQPTRVAYVTEISTGRPCYRVTFDDGTEIVTDAEHEWVVETARQRRNARQREREGYDRTVHTERLTTEQMSRSVHVPLGSRHLQVNYAIPVSPAIQTSEAILPVPPYVLGLWLGDGNVDQPVLTSAEPGIFAAVVDAGIPLGKEATSGGTRSPQRRLLGLAAPLREMGVLGHKHIPDMYLRSSPSQRRDLLAGLMDTDGCVTKIGGSRYSTTSLRLAEDVSELVRSLGHKVRMYRNTARLNGRDMGTVYTIAFTAYERVCRLDRKAARQRQVRPLRSRTGRHYVTSIVPVPSVPVRCIRVDAPSHLYLASRSFIPTHNTWTATAAMYWFLMSHPGDSIVITTAPTWPQVEDQIWREAKAFYDRARRSLGGRILKTMLEFGPKWYAVGRSTDDPINIQGYHARHILVIIDEADGIEKELWEAIDGVLTSEGAKLLAIGNPINPLSEMHRRSDEADGDPRKHVMKIAAEDVLPYSADHPYLLQPSWVDDHLRAWGGPESAMAQAKIFAEWPTQSADTLIPMGWLIRAKLRTVERGIYTYGADIARYGGNRTVRTLLGGHQLMWQRAAQKDETVETSSKIVADIEQYGPIMAAIDETGVGGGVLDQVRAYFRRKGVVNMPVIGVNNGSRANRPHRFVNRGSEMYWNVRTGFEEDRYGLACGDPDMVDELINDLSRPTYSIGEQSAIITVNKYGRLRVEAKMTPEQRSQESPDRADSFVLAANAAEPYIASDKSRRSGGGKSYLPQIPGAISV